MEQALQLLVALALRHHMMTDEEIERALCKPLRLRREDRVALKRGNKMLQKELRIELLAMAEELVG